MKGKLKKVLVSVLAAAMLLCLSGCSFRQEIPQSKTVWNRTMEDVNISTRGILPWQ